MTIQKLTDDMTGQFVLTTVSGSRYEIDLDARTFSRAQAAEPLSDDPDAHESVALRRDGETVKLLSIASAEVGFPATLVIDLNVDGVPFTVRQTTPIVEIVAA